VTARFIIGDTRQVLKTLPDNSVDLVLTSPPFLALRAYLPPDHPDKHLEMGSESTPGEFLDALLDVIEECDRVLAPHGSIAIELGDTYAGSGGAGGDYNDSGLRSGQAKWAGSKGATRDISRSTGHLKRIGNAHGWPLDKSLCFIPQALGFALAYGFNPLTGRGTDSWRVRNVVRWVRPNPPVGALADKFRPATSEMVIACKSRKRFFDLDAVRMPFSGHAGVGTGKRKGQNGAQDHENRPDDMPTRMNTHDGAPPLDWWSIPPGGYPGSHYAVYPPELCVRPVKAMVPERVCTICGEPSERIAETTNAVGRSVRSRAEGRGGRTDCLVSTAGPERADRLTTGWTDCKCSDDGSHWRNGVVLDPFAGSGTTLAVATGHGRDAIGIDLDERNADLARERVGMWLAVEDHRRKTEAAS
jgi:DNA modification methylase